MGLYDLMVQKLYAKLNLTASYFNAANGSYEPLLEPWNLEARMIQKDEFTSINLNVLSEDMLNINLTFGMALALKK